MRTEKLSTNFTAGELSPRLEGRPDLAKFFNGASILENMLVYPQGGAYRRPGLRFVAEVKESVYPTRYIEFVRDTDSVFGLEFGNQYIRFYKDNAQLQLGGDPYEISSPYYTIDLFNIHYRQSADVIYLTCPGYPQYKLIHTGDTDWTMTAVNFRPPPTVESDTDISGGTIYLTAGATTGTGVTFTASAAVFLAADAGRMIIFGTGRAIITTYTSTTVVVADIIDDLSSTTLTAGQWFLRNSPQATLDPASKGPINTKAVMTTNLAAFRAADLGKYIKVYSGVAKITKVNSTTSVNTIILKVLSDSTTQNPPAAVAGLWTLEIPAWSSGYGYPRTLEFHEGRILYFSTPHQPTTFWGSATDDYENFGEGAFAADAVEYTIASRRTNAIKTALSIRNLQMGTSETEMVARGSGGSDEALAGDAVPDVKSQSDIGYMPMQPLPAFNAFIFAQALGRQVYECRFNIYLGTVVDPPTDLTLLSEHITAPGLAQDKFAYQKQPNSIIHMLRSDGQLLALTYYSQQENVVAWSRIVTDGVIESVAAHPHPGGFRIQITVIVKRTINGVVKRYIEFFEDDAPEFSDRAWTGLQTDCATAYNGSPVQSLSNLSYLEGEEVDVVADGIYKGRQTVTSGSIVLDAPASEIEVGLPYKSTLVTMRPAIEKGMIEGLPRSWTTAFVRVQNSVSAKISATSSKDVDVATFATAPAVFSGDYRLVNVGGSDTDNRLTIVQDQPYPLIVLAIFGEIEIAEFR